MATTSEEEKMFDEEKILQSEPKFIDIYAKDTKTVHPMKLFFSFFKGQYGKLLLSAFFYFLKDSPVWVLPLITANVIDIVTYRPENAVTKMIVNFAVALVLLAQNIPNHMLHVKYFSEVTRNTEAGLRGAMIRKLQQLSITFHKDMESGKIQSKVMRDVENVTNFTNSLASTVLSVAYNMVISMVVILSKNVWVFAMFVVCIPASVLIRNKFSAKMRKRSHEYRKELENTASAVFDMEELIPVTRAHALENKEVRKLTGDIAGVARSGFRLDRLNSLFGSVNWVVMMTARLICLMFTIYLAWQGKVTTGDVTLYQSYFASMTGYVSSLIGLLPTIASGTESIRSIGEILAAYDVEDNKGKKQLKTLRGAYSFRHVSFDYDERTPVLRDFTLDVQPGETVALVGESGSCKSTIMNLVIGFNTAQKGQVLVDGTDIRQLDLHEYRKMISVVPQNSILFAGTIRQNITYGRKHITEEMLQEAVKAAQLEPVLAKLPDGLDTLVGEHGSKLSGGQRQRISIARAIIRNPRVIIFDEATSALDSVTEREIQKAIDNLTKDRTTFIVAHRLSTIRNADKIAVLKDGHCVEYGTWDELLALKGEFYAYKQAQS